jgi:hypothetical protein
LNRVKIIRFQRISNLSQKQRIIETNNQMMKKMMILEISKMGIKWLEVIMKRHTQIAKKMKKQWIKLLQTSRKKKKMQK